MKIFFAISILASFLFMPSLVTAQESVVTGLPQGIANLVNEGKIEEAKKELREYRRTHPDNAPAIYQLALLEDDRNLAMALLKEAERFGDSDMARDAAFMRAEMLYAEGSFSESEKILVPIAAEKGLTNRTVDALYRLGVIRLARGDIDNALIQFRKCRDTATDPYKKTLARAGVLECHVAKRDWNRVIVGAREVLEGKDDAGSFTPRVLEVLALAWRELGNEENADKFNRRILTDFPRSYQAHAIRIGGADLSDPQIYAPDSRDSASDSSGIRSGFSAASSSAGTDTDRVAAGDSILNRAVRYTVQAAAYELRPNALTLHNRLKDAGFPVRIEMKTVGEKHRYLVRIGLYSTREEADRIADRITRDTGVRCNVVIVR